MKLPKTIIQDGKGTHSVEYLIRVDQPKGSEVG